MMTTGRQIGWNGMARLSRDIMLVCGLCIGLASCNSVLSSPPETYDLVAPGKVTKVGGKTSAQILVLEPSALKSLDSQSIVIKPDPSVVEYLGKAQWNDTLPKVVQAKLVETFENTGRARAVGKPGEGLVIDYQIVSDIRAFEARMENGGGEAVVSISVKLVSDRTGKVVKSKIFNASVPVSSRENLAIVTGINQAFDKVARDLARWVFAAI